MNYKLQKKVTILIFTIVFVLLGYDIYHGILNKNDTSLTIFDNIFESKHELLTIALVFAGLINLWSWYSNARYEIEDLNNELIDLDKEIGLSKKELEDYFNKSYKVITSQFEKWSLSESEKQVCSLLLQGISTKEIAYKRSTSERTVRNQASIIYDKANVSGRHELSAFFLRNLFND